SIQWYRSWVDNPETVTQVNGQLVFTLAPNADAYAAYVSSASYDLTGSSVVLQVPTSANPATSAQTNLFLDGPASTSILMQEEKGQLYLSIETASGTQDIGSVLYDPVQHAWWRIRESGGTLFWETAPDGKAWAVQAQLSPLPFPVDVLDVDIQCGTYKAEANPGQSVLDNLNL